MTANFYVGDGRVTDRIRRLPTATLGKLAKADKRRVVRWWKAPK